MKSFVSILMVLAATAVFADPTTPPAKPAPAPAPTAPPAVPADPAMVGSMIRYNYSVTIPASALQPPPGTPGAPPAPIAAPGNSSGAAKSVVASLIIEKRVLSIDATGTNYNISESAYYPDGSKQDNSSVVPASQVYPRNFVLAVLAQCASQGGTPQRITTDGGDFDTCAIDNGKGTKLWIGDVPFGLVKEMSTDEQNRPVEMEVALYKYPAAPTPAPGPTPSPVPTFFQFAK
jgi:hypothetical protein